MNLIPILRGLATYVPGAQMITQKRTGGSTTAAYCYSVWLRHLVLAHKNGLCARAPRQIAEIGPGDSLGIGLAALLSGAERYVGLDVVAFSNAARNISILDALVDLFADRTDIPAPDLFPQVKPYLEDHAFPSDILTTAVLDAALSPGRVQALRRGVETATPDSDIVAYAAPFTAASVAPNSIDMIIAQAVMEYVPDLLASYAMMASWLKPGGFISLQIDFKCHGSAKEWNGHYAYSDKVWPLIKGKREYYLNREPYSKHLAAIEHAGFDIVAVRRLSRPSRLRACDMAPAFRNLSDADLITSGAFIQAKRR